MKKFLMILSVFIMVFVFQGCNEADEAGQYVLTVMVGEGATGTPATGTHNYNEDDVVTYQYTLQPGYRNLTVVLDGVAVGATGTLVIDTNHNLQVSAEQIDIRGTWSGVFDWQGAQTYFEVTFSGGLKEGTTKGLFDFVGGYGNGTFTLDGDQIDFTLNYPSCTAGNGLTLTGTLQDNSNMSGTWIWDCNTTYRTGSWTLER